MNHFINIIGDPYFWGLVFSYWLFSAAVGALESPDQSSGKFYRWFFKFANTFAGNVTRAFANKIPGADPVQQRLDDISKGDSK